MLTSREIVFGILMPLAIALIVGAVGWWTKRAWLLPVAGGIGFLAGYANSLGATGGFGLPRLPPSDGSDWLFWAAIPATALAAVVALARAQRWPALLGAWAGVVVLLILRPLVPGTLSSTTALELALTSALLGIVVCLAYTVAGDRIGHGWATLCLCIALAGAGVTVLSSNLRTVGVYGLGAAGAMGGVLLFSPRAKATQSLAVLAGSVLVGLLAAGHFYPDPGVGWMGVSVLALAPLLVLVGLWVPSNRKSVKGLAAVLAVTIAVAAVAAPAAIAAKRAAEEDPYGNVK